MSAVEAVAPVGAVADAEPPAEPEEEVEEEAEAVVVDNLEVELIFQLMLKI